MAVYGAYAYFSADEVPTSDVPEVSYEEAVEVVDEAEETEVQDDQDEVEDDQGEDGDDQDEEEVGEEEEVVEEEEEEVSEVEAAEDDSPFFGEDVGTAELPAEYNLAVPFTPQAPHADWSLPYQEACEEASSYMVYAYFSGAASGLIDADVADAALLELVAFQEDFLGYYLDTTAEETALFIDAFYGLNAMVVEDPTVDQIKTEIAAGRPVIIPAAGRELGNPFFSGEGPLYHMLVIKGYADDTFIVNDPGTYRGENYVYSIDAIMDAMGDWNNGDPASGAKRVIFVRP